MHAILSTSLPGLQLVVSFFKIPSLQNLGGLLGLHKQIQGIFLCEDAKSGKYSAFIVTHPAPGCVCASQEASLYSDLFLQHPYKKKQLNAHVFLADCLSQAWIVQDTQSSAMFALSTTKWHSSIQQLHLQASRDGQQLQLCFDMWKWDRIFFGAHLCPH